MAVSKTQTRGKGVVPGDFIGTNEEYMPNFGVYEKHGKLYSSNIGELDLDPRAHSAKVLCKTRIPKMQKQGVITLGMVAEASENVALIDIVPFKSRSFSFIPNVTTSVLHISGIKRARVRKLSDEVRIGDLVRVKVDEISGHTVRLRINERNLGVVKAFCSRCRAPLERAGYKLKCSDCGYVETRKIASDYGSGNIL